jgi:hypothetical protein
LIFGGSGGFAFANLANQLQGGNSGGLSQTGGPQGAGGGAFELGAVTGLTVTGEIDAIGGDSQGGGSGGGSGGGIFLHGASVSITGTLDVQGGAGGSGTLVGPTGVYAGGGGGGGGEILAMYQSSLSDLGATLKMAGGIGNVGSAGGASGSSGQFLSQLYGANVVPEPSSFVLLGTSALGLLGWAVRRGIGSSRP